MYEYHGFSWPGYFLLTWEKDSHVEERNASLVGDWMMRKSQTASKPAYCTSLAARSAMEIMKGKRKLQEELEFISGRHPAAYLKEVENILRMLLTSLKGLT